MRHPSSHSYAPMRNFPERGLMTQQRKQSHDDEKSHSRRIDDDAGCDLRTFICACGRIGLPGLARRDGPLGSASATCLQCFLSGDGDADGRGQCAPLSWRAEIERLTRRGLCHVGKLIFPGGQRWPLAPLFDELADKSRPGRLRVSTTRDDAPKGMPGVTLIPLSKLEGPVTGYETVRLKITVPAGTLVGRVGEVFPHVA
jgi:hypothetical protein